MNQPKGVNRKSTMRLKSVMKEIKERATLPGEPEYGGIIGVLLNYSKHGEPRTKFIELQNFMLTIIKQYHDKKFRKALKKIPGFRYSLDGYQQLLEICYLFVSLSDWKVDRYLQIARFEKGLKQHYTDAEIEALDQLYVNENGNNEQHGELAEEILSAKLIQKEMDKERVSEADQDDPPF